MSVIEAKAARVTASECGQRVSFKLKGTPSTLPRRIFDPLPIVRSELEFRRSHVLLQMREGRCPRDRAALFVFSYSDLA